MTEIAFYSNEFIDILEPVIPIQERGHQFGDGVYEVIRVYNGKPFLFDEHLNRLEISAKGILLALPYSRDEIIQIVNDGLDRSGLMDAEIYFQITRGIAPRQHHFHNVPSQFSMTIKNAKPYDSNKVKDGVPVILMEDVRWKNCYIKSLNLLPNVIAKQTAISLNCEEAILVRDGFISEGSSSNVFAVKDEKIYTTPLSNQILHGITRATVISLANKLHLEVVEDYFTPEFLKKSDEVFYTSTSAEIMPIRKIDDVTLPSQRPIAKQLIIEYKHLYNIPPVDSY